MRIAVVAGHAPSLTNFRGPLLAALRGRGHDVVALAPPEGRTAAATQSALAELGVPLLRYPLDRGGRNPVADARTLLALLRHFRALAPDLVLSYAIKPVIYGSLAARRAGVPRSASLITGLGYAFGGFDADGRTNPDLPLPRRCLGALALRLCKAALAGNSAVIFQNPDDRDFFARLGLTRPGQRIAVVGGSGVDLEKFAPAPQPRTPTPVFLCVARLLWAKGVGVYVEACRMLKRRRPEVVCRLLGPRDHVPDAVPDAAIERWRAEGVVDVLDPVDDVRPQLAAASVFVLPSFREGAPRAALEAMAMARPVITTDVPGCRQVVEDGVTGYLVPPYEPGAVLRAMERFIDDPTLVPAMGASGRRLAEEKFDARRVTEDTIAALPLADAGALA